jgi:hypothetical protein
MKNNTNITHEELESLCFSLEYKEGNRIGSGKYARYVFGEKRDFPYLVLESYPESNKFCLFYLQSEGGIRETKFEGPINSIKVLQKVLIIILLSKEGVDVSTLFNDNLTT